MLAQASLFTTVTYEFGTSSNDDVESAAASALFNFEKDDEISTVAVILSHIGAKNGASLFDDRTSLILEYLGPKATETEWPTPPAEE